MKILQPTGKWMVVNQHCQFMAHPGDSYEGVPAQWCDHPDFALKCSLSGAQSHVERLSFREYGGFHCRVVDRKQAERIVELMKNGKMAARSSKGNA